MHRTLRPGTARHCSPALRHSALFALGAVISSLLVIGPGHFRTETAVHSDASAAVAQTVSTSTRTPSPRANLPISFEVNQGQTDPSVKMVAHAGGSTYFISPTELVISLSTTKLGGVAKAAIPMNSTAPAAVGMALSGVSSTATVEGVDELPGKANYIIGNDPAKWHKNVPTYAKVKVHNVYPGIDLVYYGGPHGLEYDLDVAPGANPHSVGMNFTGASSVGLDSDGAVHVNTTAGTLVQPPAVVFEQGKNGSRIGVDAHYVDGGNGHIGLALGKYDSTKPLVIDPSLVSSTYLGGSSTENSNGIALDGSGNTYVTGFTQSTNFPTIGTPIQGSNGGSYDVFITKTNAAGTVRDYSTYLGGAGADVGYGIAVDGSGNAYVTGQTGSSNFPTKNPIQSSNGGTYNAFVAEIDPGGDALTYSTYLGGSGSGNGDAGYGIAADGSGNAYITGQTSSTNFPTKNPIQSSLGTSAPYNAFVTKIKPNGSNTWALAYSTYLGGSGGDTGYGMAVDSSGDAYAAGSTCSSNFPTHSALQSSLAGTCNAFVTKVNSAGSAWTFSTYLGGGKVDNAFAIALDGSGNAYVTGNTTSTNFPTQNPIQSSLGGTGAQNDFVTKVKADGSALVYSTYLGGSSTGDQGNGIAVDQWGNAYVAGDTTSSNFPTQNPIQSSLSGVGDATVTKVNAAGTAWAYSTYLGGSGVDGANAVAVDAYGNAWVTGSTNSTNFPTQSAIQGTSGGGWDGFVSEISPIGSQTLPSGVALALSEISSLNPSELYALCQQCLGNPVNTATGAYSESATDLSIAGRSYPLAVSRTYSSSNAATNGPLGYGWALNYGMSLAITGTSPNQVATITQETGATVVFNQSGSNWVPATPRVIATLTYNSGTSTYTFVRNNRDTFTFNSSYELTSEKDLNGYTTTLTYGGTGCSSTQLCTVTDPSGRTLTFTWSSGHITGVTDPNVSPNRSVTFQYNDGNGNLTDVIDVKSGHTQMTYDSNHQMLTLKDAKCYATSGCPGIQNTYTSGQVTAQKDGLNRLTTFSYSGTFGSAASSTTITDPMSNEVFDSYQYGLLTSETRGYGTSQAATTNSLYNPVTLARTLMVDANGHDTAYTVDASGNPLTVTDPLGRKTTNTYNSFNELLTTDDGNGVTTTNTYDSNGNLTSTARPLTGSTQVATTTNLYGDPNHPGDLTSTIDPDGGVTEIVHDVYGDVVSTTNPVGDTTTATYNSIGWQLSGVAPRGNTSGASPRRYTTTYMRDAAGEVTAITDPLHHTTSKTYDADGNVSTSTDPDGNQTSYTYDNDSELTTTTRPGGSTLTTDYNADGTVSDQKDGKGNAILSYGYNSLAQPKTVTDALSNVTTYTFDGDGNQLTKLDPVSGATCSGTKVGCTTMTYDAANELTSVSYSDGVTPNVSSITYDFDGQRTGMTDGTGTSSWTYDSLHRLTGYTNGNGATVTYGYTYGSGPSYDLKNQVRSIAYPNSVGTVNQTWNADGTLASVQDWNSNTTSFSYDQDANLTTESVPSTTAVTDTYQYNTADQLASISDVSGGTSLFSANYGRDPNGQLASDSSVPSSVNSDKYDSLNQLCYAGSSTSTACSSPPSGAQAYGFDAADNLTTNNGKAQQFNNADELCWAVSGGSGTCSSPPTGATSYNFNSLGDRTSAVPSSGSATCDSYDQANRLTKIQTGTGSSCTSPSTVGTYGYDGAGTRESKTISGTTTQYTWDGTGGNLLQQKAGSTTTSYIYGPGRSPVEQISGSTTYWLHHDQLGSTRLVTNSSGSSAATFTYDPYGNVTSCTNATVTVGGSNVCTGTSIGNITLMFGGQFRDDESNLYYLRARFYDPTTAQFLTRDPAVARTMSPYGYVAGNPLNAMDPSGLIACGSFVSDLRELSSSAPGSGSGDVSEAAFITLYRAVGATEAEQILQTGQFDLGQMSFAKDFFYTREQAESFGARMNTLETNGEPYEYIASGQVDESTLAASLADEASATAPIAPATEGEGVAIGVDILGDVSADVVDLLPAILLL